MRAGAGLGILALGSLTGEALAGGIIVESPDERCIALPGSFPPGFDFIEERPGEVLIANFNPGVVVPVDVESEPPSAAAPGPFFDLRTEIANAACAGGRDPLFDGIVVLDGDLGLVTASSCEAVAFVSPATGGLLSLEVGVPAGFPEGLYPFGPTPGSMESRVALSTRACVSGPLGVTDSRGDAVSPSCDAGAPSWFTSFTSGVAVAGASLFVSTSNLGAGAGTILPQFLPGTVLVFDYDPDVGQLQPDAAIPWIFTSGFNPTHLTPYTTPGGRDLLLVTVTGATGLIADDPGTPERETGGLALTEAAVDVLDPWQRRLVATIPLGLAALSFDRLAIDPTGRVALTGSSVERLAYAVDLAPLDTLSANAPYVVLDGVSAEDAVIFDAGSPLVLPALPGGAPAETCPGFVVSMDFAPQGSYAFGTDFCDGTLLRVDVDLSPPPPAPVPPERFSVAAPLELVAPLDPSSLGLPRALGAVRVRPGIPGEDFSGPNVVFVAGLPEGLLCGVHVAVPEPASGLQHGALSLLLWLSTRRRRKADKRRKR